MLIWKNYFLLRKKYVYLVWYQKSNIIVFLYQKWNTPEIKKISLVFPNRLKINCMYVFIYKLDIKNVTYEGDTFEFGRW